MLTVVALAAVAMMSSIVGYLLFLHGPLAASSSSTQESASWRCVPEYDRQLRKVVFSLAKRDTSLALQHSLLAALPRYTDIILLLPESSVEQVRGDLQNKPYRDRVQFVTYPAVPLKNSKVWMLFRDNEKLVQLDMDDSCVGSYNGNIWAQDMFEVARDSGGRTLLLRACIHKFWSTGTDEAAAPVAPDNMYLDQLSAVGVEVRTLPLAFMGGNIFIDEIDGEQLAFCGGDILRTTRAIFKAVHGTSPADAKTAAVLKDALNVDKVVLIGAERLQPTQMYHLDQAMLLLSDRTVAVARIVGDRPHTSPHAEEIKESEHFLTALRSKLRSLGYRVADIDVSVQNVLRCQHYVNAIPYVDAETNQRTLLMPTYLSAQTDFDKSLIRRNTRTLESLGYKVVHVPTRADELRGGIHCFVNVLE